MTRQAHLSWKTAAQIASLSQKAAVGKNNSREINTLRSILEPLFEKIIQERTSAGYAAPGNSQKAEAFAQTIMFSAMEGQIFNIWNKNPSSSKRGYNRVFWPAFISSFPMGAVLAYMFQSPIIAAIPPLLIYFMRKADFHANGIKPEFEMKQDFFQSLADNIVDRINGIFDGPAFNFGESHPSRSGTMTRQTALSILNIPAPNPSKTEIKRAWKILVKEHYPRVNQGDQAAEDMMKGINAAYTFLTGARR